MILAFLFLTPGIFTTCGINNNNNQHNINAGFSFFLLFNPGDLNFLGQKIYYNNNNHDNVYDAVIMTKVVARVHPVHLMNVD